MWMWMCHRVYCMCMYVYIQMRKGERFCQKGTFKQSSSSSFFCVSLFIRSFIHFFFFFFLFLISLLFYLTTQSTKYTAHFCRVVWVLLPLLLLLLLLPFPSIYSVGGIIQHRTVQQYTLDGNNKSEKAKETGEERTKYGGKRIK